MARDYDAVSLPASPFGQAMYQLGRRLIRQDGVRLGELVWDADEVLWDWVMDVSRMVRNLPNALRQRSVAHREYFRVKPGMFELLLGMHHASLDLGHDPHMRIWTNGYAWRIWRVAHTVPELSTLLGADAAAGPEEFTSHPRLFCRQDFAAAALRLLDPAEREEALRDLPLAAGRVIARQFAQNPLDSHFKLPELARITGKDGFTKSTILIDDRAQNISRFVASGRRGIRVNTRARRLRRGRVQNLAWFDPWGTLERISTNAAPVIAEALGHLARTKSTRRLEVNTHRPVGDYVHTDFTIDIPDLWLRTQWITPMQRLRRAVRKGGSPLP